MILLACPKCFRQYDVTHLAPRSKVRCICDERFEVTWSRPFVIARLQCGNCGGAISLDDHQCSYCGLPVPEGERRQDSLCPRCFARIREDSRHCHACGVEIRPQALAPIPDGEDCPRCAGELRIRMLDEVSVIECTACEGMWVEAGIFERLCHEARTDPPAAAPATRRDPPPSTSVATVKYIPCITCGELMFRRQFRYADHPSGVILDRCRDHGVWLDRDELEQVVRFLATASALAARPAPSVPSYLPIEPKRSRRPLRSPLTTALEFLGDLLFSDPFFD